MSYTTVVARISELDALIRSVDPGWQSSFGSGNLGQAIDGNSPFSGLLQTYASNAGQSAVPSVMSGSAVVSPPFTSPLPGSRLTQAFGPTDLTLEPAATVGGVTYAHYHNGIDLAAPLGTSIHAASGGTVTYAGTQSDGCVVVKIRHDDGYTTMYGHLDPALQVSVGQQVSAGQVIGKVGLTGNTTGPHLHFSLFASDGTAIDPSSYLAAGHLPDPPSLLGPSTSDAGALTQESAATVLAHFDAVSSQIPYAAQVRAAAVSAGIDPFLLTSLVWAESSFHPNAVSGCGAQGLTQLMPGTARGLGVTDSFDPQQNLNGGAKYIATQIKRFGRVDMALAAYNAGPGAVAQLGRVPDSKWGYVNKILNTWSSYQESSK
jgi:hypothetical protein